MQLTNTIDYQLQQDFKPGPYYKNERGVLQTALAPLPARVNELGQTEALGVLMSSMPPEARSYYDSFGDSVAMCVRYDLGRVCYLAQDFKPLMRMPVLQLELAGTGDTDEQRSREAERELEALGRKTDTWLAIFQVCACVCEPSGFCLCVCTHVLSRLWRVLGCQSLPYMTHLCCCWRWMGGLRSVTLFSKTSRFCTCGRGCWRALRCRRLSIRPELGTASDLT